LDIELQFKARNRLNLGYSHPVKIEIPETVSVEVVQNTTINLKSCDKEF
jgi:ribosomal protein L6P/L9E